MTVEDGERGGSSEMQWKTVPYERLLQEMLCRHNEL